jgi:predicted membrane channel-forming protein YqfA (hemolysin III family)
MEIRPGSGWFGVPVMIALFAFLAFRGEHLLIALVALPVVFLVIGAVVWFGKRRD